MHRYMVIAALGVLLVSLMPGPAMAESFGNSFGRGLTQLVLAAIAYLAFFIALIVLGVMRYKRALKLTALAGFALIVVVPLIDKGLMAWQTSRIAKAQITQTAPDLRAKTLLYITTSDRCNYLICEALMALRGGVAMWIIPPEELAKIDFSAPVDLTTVPLARMIVDPDGFNRFLTETAPTETPRPEFDYVIIERRPFYLSRAGQIESGLHLTPKATLLGGYLSLELLAASITDNQMDLGTIQPDYLSFYNARSAFKVPLFPENTVYGSTRDYDWAQARQEWFCGSGDLSDAQHRCKRALQH